MDFEITVVAVRLAREQAFELAPRRLGAQLFERGLGLAELDQFERLVDFALDPPVAADRLIEPGALAQQLLRRGRVIP